MGHQGPPGAKETFSFNNHYVPHGMPKQLFLVRFELVVARFGPPKISECLENGVVWDEKWVKNVFSRNVSRPFGVPEQVK